MRPVYSADKINAVEESAAEKQSIVNKVQGCLPRINALVVGPGLGNNNHVLASVQAVRSPPNTPTHTRRPTSIATRPPRWPLAVASAPRPIPWLWRF